MSVSQISSNTSTFSNTSTAKVKASSAKASEKAGEKYLEPAAVYEKGETPKKKSNAVDAATIERMKQDAEKRTQSLRDLVEKLMLKQGQTINDATDIYELLREGKVTVDPETRAQAQKDIAEDGYWGVEQTSERLLSFAKALVGGDPTKADEMIAAVKKGFEQAKEAWGGELPDICKNTLDSAVKKLEAWRDTNKADDAMAKAAADTFQNQASTDKFSK